MLGTKYDRNQRIGQISRLRDTVIISEGNTVLETQIDPVFKEHLKEKFEQVLEGQFWKNQVGPPISHVIVEYFNGEFYAHDGGDVEVTDVKKIKIESTIYTILLVIAPSSRKTYIMPQREDIILALFHDA